MSVRGVEVDVVVLAGAWMTLSRLRAAAVRKLALRSPIFVWSVSLVVIWS